MIDFIQPSFSKPPVAETVLSVQFETLPGFSNAHLGAFWKTMGGNWPHVSDALPLDPTFERFGDDMKWLMGLAIRLRTEQAARLQIRNIAGDRMIQLQNGRLAYNWLRGEAGDYAGYRAVKPGFGDLLASFAAFLASEGLPEIKPNQWEVTYVNHLKRGPLWKTPDDWQALIGGFMPNRSLHPSLHFESVAGEWHFEIEPRRGRLHIELQHGRIGTPAGDESLIVKMTARGPIGESCGTLTVDAGLDLGHDTIVDSFKRLTSDAAQHIWEAES
jgi:uncharacterized protein (TIGR04255 family)